MKKIIIVALTALMVVGCIEQYEDTRITSYYSVRVIDSCEYIFPNGGSIKAHKGNCRFCEERDSIKWEKRKKEILSRYGKPHKSDDGENSEE